MLPSSPKVTRSMRLFLALWPDDDGRRQITNHCQEWVWPCASVQYQPDDWHVTLHFIGAVDADRLGAIGTSVDVPMQPFELVLDQPQLWPHGLAVLCAGSVPTPLRELHARLGLALRALVLPVDPRPYQPHVTLARRAQGAVLPLTCAPVRWAVQGYALVVSTRELHQRYQVLRRYG